MARPAPHPPPAHPLQGSPGWDEAPPYRRALVVANPIAGRGQCGKAALDLRDALRQLGIAVELHLTRGRGDAFRHMRSLDHEIDLVVAVGGDGTVREVVAGLVQIEVPLGILPMGTANVMATEFGLPRDVHETVEILARKHLAAFDVAHVNGHLSCFVTGVGVDGMAVQEVERRRKGPITKFSYVTAVCHVMSRYRAPRLSVELDGERLREPRGLVLVSNARGYGGVFTLNRRAALDDGLLEVYLLATGSRWELARCALRASLSELASACEVRLARHVAITSEEPVPYQVDGDFRGHTPVEIEVGKLQYHLVVP